MEQIVAAAVHRAKKMLYFCCALQVTAHGLFAVPFGEQLAVVIKSGSPTEIERFLKESYAANQDDPEYFIAAANYWWEMAQRIEISASPSEKGDFSVAEAGTGKEVGSISSLGKLHPEIPQKAVDLLSEGFGRNPYRFDVAMGLAYMLRDRGQFKACADVLKKALRHAVSDPAKIRWRGGTLPEKPLDRFVPETLQGYTAGFYRLQTKEGDALCRELCEALVSAYPGHPYAYNILAALCSAKEDYKGCVKYLQMALEISPDDTLVVLNLADSYRRMGDKGAAKGYYERVLSSKASAEERAEARRALVELQ
jgi:tetratricopeptide (TPR) repeat protein